MTTDPPASKRAKITDENRAESARLKSLWAERPHRTQAEFGEHYGLGNQANVGHYLNARSALNAKAAAAFAAELGCSVADFSPRVAREIEAISGATGFRSGEFGTPTAMQLQPGIHIQHAPVTFEYDDAADIMIPQYDTGGRMGSSGLVLKDQPGVIKHLAVSEEWAQKNVHRITNIRNLAVVTGFGDSMRPTFNPGDPLLVDTGIKTIDHDGVYFFRVDGEGFVKRLQRVPKQSILVISDNPKYRDWEISANDDFEIFGKVVKAWCGEDF